MAVWISHIENDYTNQIRVTIPKKANYFLLFFIKCFKSLNKKKKKIKTKVAILGYSDFSTHKRQTLKIKCLLFAFFQALIAGCFSKR